MSSKPKVRTGSRGIGARKIYKDLRDQIVEGVYGLDGLLPSSRALAGELGVSRNTVTAAYEQLVAEGYIYVRHGARPQVAPSVVGKPAEKPLPSQAKISRPISAFGERVRGLTNLPQASTGGLFADFRYGDMSAADFPTLAWRKAMTSSVMRRPARLSYSDPRGSLRLRAALQGYLWRARVLRCETDQIIIVNGSQQGLDLCARLLLDTGDGVVVEEPGYGMARHIFSAMGAMPIPIPVDDEGMQVDRLDGLSARVAYITPSHQFPLGSVLPIGRRQQLLAWADRAKAYIIEDDYDSEYRYDMNPIPPLRALGDQSNVIYVGTVSKTLSPTLRIGYVVVPEELKEVFARAKALTDRHTPVVEQDALASLIEKGTYESHVRRIRRLNGQRRAALLHALDRWFGDSVSIQGADAGLHFVVWFQKLSSALGDCLKDKARVLGVGIHSVAPHYIHEADPCRKLGLVMGYAALDEHQIARGVELLRQAYDDAFQDDKSLA